MIIAMIYLITYILFSFYTSDIAFLWNSISESEISSSVLKLFVSRCQSPNRLGTQSPWKQAWPRISVINSNPVARVKFYFLLIYSSKCEMIDIWSHFRNVASPGDSERNRLLGWLPFSIPWESSVYVLCFRDRNLNKALRTQDSLTLELANCSY